MYGYGNFHLGASNINLIGQHEIWRCCNGQYIQNGLKKSLLTNPENICTYNQNVCSTSRFQIGFVCPLKL